MRPFLVVLPLVLAVCGESWPVDTPEPEDTDTDAATDAPGLEPEHGGDPAHLSYCAISTGIGWLPGWTL